MTRFRKKPIEVEAMRVNAYTELLGPAPWNDNMGGEVWAWVERNGGRISCEQFDPGPAYGMVTTLEGVMRADIGDWIIRGVEGEFYPCKPSIFDATYEPVSAEDTPSERLSAEVLADEPLWRYVAGDTPSEGDAK